jgi:hypothetical protein
MMDRVMPRTVAPSSPSSAAQTVSARVRGAITSRAGNGAERTWRINDFPDMPATAVAQALSRLSREGAIVRLSKGVYAVKGSAAGRVRVYDARVQPVQRARAPLFPCSVSAANALRLSLQCPNRLWYSTPASRAPSELDKSFTRVVTRRPKSWVALEPLDGALLEVLRDGCIHSELEPRQTALVIRDYLLEEGRLKRIMSVARDEPPRVRAMLGALLEHGKRKRPPEVHAAIRALRASLNPLSRYGFGQLSLMPGAPQWQARRLKPLS